MKKGDYSSRNEAVKFHHERFVGRGGDLIKKWEKRTLLEFLKQYKPEKVMDLGAGTGRISEIIISELRPKKIVLVDSSKAMLNFAQERIKNTKSTVVKFEIRDVTKLKNKEKFDLVIAFHLVKHLENVETFLDSVNKVLSDNGKFIFDFANKNSLVQLGRGEVKLYGLQEMLNKSEAEGFFIKEIRGVNFFGETVYLVLPYFLTRPLLLLDELVCSLVPELATKIFLKLEKNN